MKNIYFAFLSLLVSLSALRAVPTDPNSSTTPTDPTTPSKETVILTNQDSGKSFTVKTSQVYFVINLSSDLSDQPFVFSDSSLLNVKKVPYKFEVSGLTVDGTEEFLLAINSTTDPIFLGNSGENYSHVNLDGTYDTNGNANYNLDLLRTTSYLFYTIAAGSTTLTFDNGTHVYTYKITVVDDTPTTTPTT